MGSSRKKTVFRRAKCIFQFDVTKKTHSLTYLTGMNGEEKRPEGRGDLITAQISYLNASGCHRHLGQQGRDPAVGDSSAMSVESLIHHSQMTRLVTAEKVG